MEHLRFKNYSDLKKFITGLKVIGQGGEGIVYLLNNKWSLKIFRKPQKNIDSILPFLNLEVDGFAFPICLVYVKYKVVGIIAPYVRGKDIWKIPLANKKIDDVIYASKNLVLKIEKISNLGIYAWDVIMENIVYGFKKLTVIDTINFELAENPNLLAENIHEIMNSVTFSAIGLNELNISTFLILNNSRYKNYPGDIELLSHPEELFLGIKGELEEFIGQEIICFSDAKEPLKRKLVK